MCISITSVKPAARMPSSQSCWTTAAAERAPELGAEGPHALPELCSAVRRRECIHRQSDRHLRGEQRTVLDAADLYEYDYTDYYTTGAASVTFGGEKQISSAIYKLTAASRVMPTTPPNHGEQTLTDSLTEALDAQNIDAQPLDLLTGTIPEDCDLLIINAPTTDFFRRDSLVDEISAAARLSGKRRQAAADQQCLRPKRPIWTQ